MRRSGGILASDSGKSSTQIGSLLLFPSIVIAEVTPTDSTPPMASMRLAISSCMRATCAWSLITAVGIEMRSVSTASGR